MPPTTVHVRFAAFGAPPRKFKMTLSEQWLGRHSTAASLLAFAATQNPQLHGGYDRRRLVLLSPDGRPVAPTAALADLLPCPGVLTVRPLLPVPPPQVDEDAPTVALAAAPPPPPPAAAFDAPAAFAGLEPDLQNWVGRETARMLREDGCGASETAQLSALTVALNAAGRHAEAAAAAACAVAAFPDGPAPLARRVLFEWAHAERLLGRDGGAAWAAGDAKRLTLRSWAGSTPDWENPRVVGRRRLAARSVLSAHASVAAALAACGQPIVRAAPYAVALDDDVSWTLELTTPAEAGLLARSATPQPPVPVPSAAFLAAPAEPIPVPCSWHAPAAGPREVPVYVKRTLRLLLRTPRLHSHLLPLLPPLPLLLLLTRLRPSGTRTLCTLSPSRRPSRPTPPPSASTGAP